MAEDRSYPFDIEPPNELIFNGPFVAPVNQTLRLTNRSDRRVGFKVKTTAPTRYCVRPNAGLLDPSQSTAVTIVLNAFEYNESERNKHKFMVQALAVGPDVTASNLDAIFKTARSDELQDRKLKCTLVPEPDGAAGAKGLGQNSSRNVSSGGSFVTAGDEVDPRRKLEQLERENQKLRDSETRLRRQMISDSAKQAPTASAPPAQSGPVATSSGGVGFWLGIGLFMALIFVLGISLGTLYIKPLLDQF